MLKLALVVVVALAASGPVSAHPADGPKSPGDVAVEKDVLEFRETHKQAIAAKDLAKLRAIYAETYTHTHGSGKMDPKDARIIGLSTAIVTGKSPILNKQENKTYDFRWMCVYVKTDATWRLGASQATRLPGPGR